MRAWIGLGSNQGDPAAHLRAAVEGLAALPDTALLRVSPVYRTAPVGHTDQAAFLNAVAELDTGLDPRDLLRALHELERSRGRRRDEEIRWGPRNLDLDVLVFGDRRIHLPDLEVPHPRLAQRAFVLVPLADLAPDLEIPGVGRVAELLQQVDAAGVAPHALDLDASHEEHRP